MLGAICCGQVICQDIELTDGYVVCPQCGSVHMWESGEVSDLSYRKADDPDWIELAIWGSLPQHAWPPSSDGLLKNPSKLIRELAGKCNSYKHPSTNRLNALAAHLNLNPKTLMHAITTGDTMIRAYNQEYADLHKERMDIGNDKLFPYMSRGSGYPLPIECIKANEEWRKHRETRITEIDRRRECIVARLGEQPFAGEVIYRMFGMGAKDSDKPVIEKAPEKEVDIPF